MTTTNQVNRQVDIEALLFEQEHRIFRLLHNYFLIAPKLANDDPRRAAITKAIVWRLICRILCGTLPTVAATSVGVLAIVTLYIQIDANRLLQAQNQALIEAEIESEMQDLQKELMGDPILRNHFHRFSPLPRELTEDQLSRVDLMAERYCDLFEHISLRFNLLSEGSQESWIAWIQAMHSNCSSIQNVLSSHPDWYGDELLVITSGNRLALQKLNDENAMIVPKDTRLVGWSR